MYVSNAFRRPGVLTAVALCSLAIVAVATPASARPHHGASRHSHSHHVKHHISKHHRYRHVRHRRARHAALVENQASENTGGFGVVSDIVAEARRYIGGNPTGRSRLWCARFMNFVLQRSGHQGTGSDLARSFASYGHRVSGPQVGAIAVMSRRGGGHVGVVSGVDAKGNPIIISGNHGRRVAEATYSRGRVYAYVMPSS
ncbi:uncharacterized protein (TIGR02594 family) [Nitrobacteraceae bacterium AZCC 1564]